MRLFAQVVARLFGKPPKVGLPEEDEDENEDEDEDEDEDEELSEAIGVAIGCLLWLGYNLAMGRPFRAN